MQRSALVAQGNLPEALKSFRDGLAIADRLAKADPDNAGWQRDLPVSYERVGGIYVRMGNRDLARQAFEQARRGYETLIKRNPEDVPSRVFSVVPRLCLAELDPRNERTHLEAALAILRPLARENRLDAKRLAWIPQIEAQLAAGGG